MLLKLSNFRTRTNRKIIYNPKHKLVHHEIFSDTSLTVAHSNSCKKHEWNFNFFIPQSLEILLSPNNQRSPKPCLIQLVFMVHLDHFGKMAYTCFHI